MYALSSALLGPLTNDKLLIFIRFDLLESFGISSEISDFTIIENLLFYSEGNFSFMRLQEPIKYYFFNDEDRSWVLDYLKLNKA